jgi:uncharacterized protein (UPF0335 family)
MADTERKTLDDVKIKRDRDTLGVLIAKLKRFKEEEKTAKEEIKALTPQATMLLQGYDIKALVFQEKVFSVVNGINISYAHKKLAETMLKHGISAAKIAIILDEAKAATAYTTLMMTDLKKTVRRAGEEGGGEE